jgi:hypothetical protein
MSAVAILEKNSPSAMIVRGASDTAKVRAQREAVPPGEVKAEGVG